MSEQSDNIARLFDVITDSHGRIRADVLESVAKLVDTTILQARRIKELEEQVRLLNGTPVSLIWRECRNG